MFSITSRKISTGSKFELTKGHFYMEGCPPLPPRGVKAITTISIRKVSKREYLPMYIDTVCLPGISVVTVTTTRSFGGGGGGGLDDEQRFLCVLCFHPEHFRPEFCPSFQSRSAGKKNSSNNHS